LARNPSSDNAPAAFTASSANSASHKGQRGQAGAERVRADQRDAVLGSEGRNLDVGLTQRLGSVENPPPPLGLTAAREGKEKLRQHAEIGPAERPDPASPGMHTLVQQILDRASEVRLQTRCAARDPGKTDEQRSANFLLAEMVADPDGAGRHEPSLEGGRVRGGKRSVDRRAEAGCQAIDRPIARREPFDHGARPVEPVDGSRSQTHPRIGTGHRRHILHTQLTATDLHAAPSRAMPAGGRAGVAASCRIIRHAAPPRDNAPDVLVVSARRPGEQLWAFASLCL
jgi:hypothetical protein